MERFLLDHPNRVRIILDEDRRCFVVDGKPFTGINPALDKALSRRMRKEPGRVRIDAGGGIDWRPPSTFHVVSDRRATSGRAHGTRVHREMHEMVEAGRRAMDAGESAAQGIVRHVGNVYNLDTCTHALALFFGQRGWRVVASEYQVFDEALHLATAADAIVRTHTGDLKLIEIKTGMGSLERDKRRQRGTRCIKFASVPYSIRMSQTTHDLMQTVATWALLERWGIAIASASVVYVQHNTGYIHERPVTSEIARLIKAPLMRAFADHRRAMK